MNFRLLLRIVTTALAYAAFGWVSLQATIPPEYVSVIFIPAGLALGAVLSGGNALLAGVWLGSVGVQWVAHSQAGSAPQVWPLLLIPLGATLQAWLTAAWIRRQPGYPSPLDHPKQVALMMFLCAPVGSLVSASVAVPTLGLTGVIPNGEWLFSWWTWWLGDTLGVLLFTPLLLVMFGQPAAAWRPRLTTVALPMLLALALVSVVFHEWNRSNARAMQEAFDKIGQDMAQRLQRRFDAQTDTVVAMEALMSLASNMSEADFATAAQTWLQRYPGTQNFGWSPLVPHDRRAAYERSAWPIQGRDALGHTYPAPAADTYLPITWVTPLDNNRSVLGLDVSVLPTTARAVEATRRSRQTEVTPALRLVQENGDQRGVVMYRAVYPDGHQATTTRFKGVVSAVFRMDDVVRSTLGEVSPEEIRWCLEDLNGEPGNRRLAGPVDCENASDRPHWHNHWPLTIAGHTWRLHVETGPAFWDRGNARVTWITTITGLVAVAILGTFLIVITGQRRRTEQLVAERTSELTLLAHFDPLTGMANRSLWMQQAESALARARQHGQQMAVIFLDLDRFKQINDSLGHSQGDLLLKTVADRIRACLRSRDVVARFGGDEFVLLMPWLKGREGAAIVTAKVVHALEQPVVLGEHHITATASLGVAMYPEDGATVEELLRHADTAMYTVKNQGRNHWSFFSPEMHEHVSQRVLIESGLRRALQTDPPHGLFLEYQPLVEARTGRVESFEALLRWEHPELGRIAPGTFIPAAEESGLIEALGRCALRQACRQIQAWESVPDSPFSPGLSVALNVSALEFNRPGFLEHLQHTLREFDIRAGRLELEITESLLIQAGPELTQQLDTVTGLGIALALDDFGTGYSSLGYLKRLPLSKLKIDRSFVQNVPDDTDDATIIRATLSMAHDLGLRVVAEGVETEAQRDFLARHHCDAYQGWLYSHALAADAVLPWLLATNAPAAH